MALQIQEASPNGSQALQSTCDADQTTYFQAYSTVYMYSTMYDTWGKDACVTGEKPLKSD